VGVDPGHVRLFIPLKKNHDQMVKIMKEEVAFKGVSVIIGRRECVQHLMKIKKLKK
jgi:indolepyruvate ferredoxin oxidoreductase, alpha subunit